MSSEYAQRNSQVYNRLSEYHQTNSSFNKYELIIVRITQSLIKPNPLVNVNKWLRN